ncbi:MAG: hypothetical protein JOZ41_09715 [Chloroflexi bacterium]|nr:hypothetical protein [Chloroflexota bacterium]
MKRFSEIADRELTWAQPDRKKRVYQARADGEVVASIGWDKGSGSLAVAESADGRWTLKRSGFLRPRITIRVAGADLDLATFHASWDGGGRLELRNGRTFHWNNTNVLHTAWAWTGPSQTPLLRFKGKRMTIEAAGLAVPELSLLALLSWYLNIVNNESDAGAIAVATVVSIA